jgi:adenosine deaminase
MIRRDVENVELRSPERDRMRLRHGPAARAWRTWLQRLPKVDLHRHLEGSLRLSTLLEIARRHKLPLGLDPTPATLEPLLRVTASEPADFQRFLARFQILRRFYTSEEAIRRMAYEAVADAAADGVRYLELRFNPAALAQAQGFRLEEVTEWVLEGVRRAEGDFDIMVRLIMTIVRGEDPEMAWRIARLAVAHRRDGVVGLDLAWRRGPLRAGIASAGLPVGPGAGALPHRPRRGGRPSGEHPPGDPGPGRPSHRPRDPGGA